MEINLDALSDGDWNAVADGLRRLVQTSGFIEWDHDYMSSLLELREEPSTRDFIVSYVSEFAEFLSIRSEDRLNMIQEGLGRELRPAGSVEPVKAVLVGDDGDISLFEHPVRPELIAALEIFATAVRNLGVYEVSETDDPSSGPKI